MIYDALFQGLVKRQAKDIVPADAASWDISEDGKRYTFKLHENIFWSDGEPVTAEDYLLGFRRLVDPNINELSRAIYLVSPIRNADRISDGKARIETLGVSAPDKKTLIFDLESPSSFFLEVLAYPGLVPVPGHMVRRHGNDWWKQYPLVSNGPYRLTGREHDGSLHAELRQRELFPLAPQRVRFQLVKNSRDAVRMIQGGELDIIHSLTLADLSWLREAKGYKIVKSVLPGTFYATFNCANPKFSDVRVRRALALAIDRDKIAKATGETPATTFAVEWMLEEGKELLEDPNDGLSPRLRQERARELLAEAGYNAQNPLEISVLTLSHNTIYKAAVALRSMFARVGVQAELLEQDNAEFWSHLRLGKYDASIAIWQADYSDGATFYSVLRSNHGANVSNFSSPVYKDLMDQALLEANEKTRQKIYAKMENFLRKQVPIYPLTHSSKTSIVSTRIKSTGQEEVSWFWISAYDVRLQ